MTMQAEMYFIFQMILIGMFILLLYGCIANTSLYFGLVV